MEHLIASLTAWIEPVVRTVVGFVEANQAWIIPVTFLLAFGESLAFISLILPSTVILLGISAILANTNVGGTYLFFIWLAAGLGGSLGYWVSYLIGWWFKDDVGKIWPFNSRPLMLKQGREFFDKWGALGVFLGHFFGPVRAVIPVIAGTLSMRQLPFQIANISSAFLWALGVMVLPLFGIRWFIH
jgi:membrane protein DedA with SNARE-associated domain